MQKFRKILIAVSEKTALPTNYYQQHRSYRISLMSVQKQIIQLKTGVERNSKL